MRHLGSIVLSLILAPAVYLLAGIGLVEAVGNASVAGHPDYLKVTLGILAIGAAGLLYSLLVLTRLSPTGPVLAGLLYLTVSVWALFSYASLGKLLPDSVLGVHGAADAPLTGVALILVVPLLLTILSPRRWRRYAQAAPAAANGAGSVGYQPPPAYNPSYPPPAGYQPGYPAPATQSPLDATRPLYPPPMAPPVMAPAPTSPAPVSAPVGLRQQPEPPVDPDAPTHKLGI
jgi:hypothetical protein